MNKSDFVSETRQAVTDLTDALEELNNLFTRYNAVALGSQLTDGDCGMPVADFIAAFTTLQAFNGLMDAGHKTNLYKVRY